MRILKLKAVQTKLTGSQVVRYSLSLLKEIQLPRLPSIETQRIMGIFILNNYD